MDYLQTKCLIVDDSRTVRKIIARILGDMGFSCDEAPDGLAALEYCRGTMPELVLLDWNMPVMNGIEFLRELRAMDGGDAPRVVFCTTENSLDFIQEGLAAGADEYIMKPFDREVVMTKLAQLGY